jgi:Tfp pilus assembly protein PilX
MIAALLVVFAVATLSMIHIQLDLAKAREQRAAVDTKRAFYLAEAGLAGCWQPISPWPASPHYARRRFPHDEK